MAEEENTPTLDAEEGTMERSTAEEDAQEAAGESGGQVEGGESEGGDGNPEEGEGEEKEETTGNDENTGDGDNAEQEEAKEEGGDEEREEGGEEEQEEAKEEGGDEQKEEGGEEEQEEAKEKGGDEQKEDGGEEDGEKEGAVEDGGADVNEEEQKVEETESGGGEKAEATENEETGENEAEPEAAEEEEGAVEEVPEDEGKEEVEEEKPAPPAEEEEKEAEVNEEETLDAVVVANGGDDADEEIDEVVNAEEGEKEAVKDHTQPQTNGDDNHVPDFIAMSTNAAPADLGALQQAIADVRNDEGGVGRKSWVLVGHTDNNPNVIDVIGQDVSAEASLEDFVNKLEDDQVMYGLLRLTTAVDMSNTVKFIYVHWVGDGVPFAKKGRFGVVHGSVKEHFGTFHVQLETGNKDDLKEEELVKVLEESSFTRNKVLESGVEGRQERGFTAHQVKSKQGGHLRTCAPAGAAVEVEPELNQAIGDVRNDKDEKQWVLAGYQDGNLKKPLTLVASGAGDIEELKESLEDDQVMYGLLRTSDLVDDITTVKFVYIFWLGDKVKPMMKGKVSAYAGPVEHVFSPIHVKLSFGNRYEITSEIIKDKVMSGSGSKSFVK